MSESNQKNNHSQNHCPLCGELNRCAVTEGKSIDDCWCSVQKIPQALLDKLPAEQRGNACVCQACIIAYNQDKFE